MRLKHLELQGYKSFASRTDFIFDGGITAIVGPNGSGKSNVADAVRWVLGEQSFRTLRGKRTEDMIFSGSTQRARLGMASASIILDNADGWLPIDFTEVTITRRAYRSGENEYLLNGRRIRLRDITELLARSGLARRTYTVIGQGLVDDVLSLRPEDRRALFEEASGITLHQAKRAEALSRLEETFANLLRANDIINEIAPRLRRLEREAERAERYALLSQQLEGLLRTWYGFRWHQEQLDLQRARDAMARREVGLARQREALDALDEQMAALRARQSRLRGQLGGWHRESSDLHRQMEEVQRDLAVWQERARLLARQSDEWQAEVTELEAQAQATAERVAATEKEAADCQAILGEQEALVIEAQVDLDTHEGQRADLSQQMAQVQASVVDLTTQIADRGNRLAQLNERREALAQERTDHLAAITSRQARADELRVGVQALEARQIRLRSAGEDLKAETAQSDAALVAVQARQAGWRTALDEAQRTLERLQARYELLTRLRAEGEGLYAGVRAVLQAMAAQQQTASHADSPISRSTAPLTGIVGTVAQCLHVPAEYEAAIEVALGGHLQDVIVASWADAEAAVAFLREGKRGRATFLPLDTVRPLPRLEVPPGPGVVGMAADLVHAEEGLAPVVDVLLGRTALVRDLEAARRILQPRSEQAFDQTQSGFQIVTLAGELLHSTGSIAGGQAGEQAQDQVLAREREWRELPGRVQAAQVRCQELELDLAQAQAAGQRVREQMAALAARQGEIEQASGRIQAQRRKLEQDGERIAQRVAWRRGLVGQLDREAQELDAAESSLRSDLAQLAAGKKVAEERVSALQAELDQLRGEVLYQRLSEARTAAAVTRGTWEHLRTTVDGLGERQAQVQAQIETKRERIAALDGERSSLAEQIKGQTSQEVVVQGWLAALAQKIEPAEAEIAHLEAERERMEREETTLRARLREAESRHAQALLTQSRQEDRLERLRRQIMDDLGLVEMEPTEGMPEQPPLPWGEMVSALPVVERLPEGLEEEIHQIKAQMRRMGSVNPNAPDEYAEALDRYTFLTTQAADLDEAARGLREVIAELDAIMRHEFHSAFKDIAARFKENFTQLFGGGTARLLLTDPEDVSQTGVEIVARPPGKRQQTLALLSGGERALTAVALIFSILEVSPPPFCILDEVDAMLDEANVKRFRQALVTLSHQTQFIIITHNRSTIQVANTIYGVSMGEDSVSQVVSLRLEGERIAAQDGSTVDVIEDG